MSRVMELLGRRFISEDKTNSSYVVTFDETTMKTLQDCPKEVTGNHVYYTKFSFFSNLAFKGYKYFTLNANLTRVFKLEKQHKINNVGVYNKN